jgi:hypothetical protein
MDETSSREPDVLADAITDAINRATSSDLAALWAAVEQFQEVDAEFNATVEAGRGIDDPDEDGGNEYDNARASAEYKAHGVAEALASILGIEKPDLKDAL